MPGTPIDATAGESTDSTARSRFDAPAVDRSRTRTGSVGRPSRDVQVLVVGGGVGGLALAGLLWTRGIRPVVVEASDPLSRYRDGVALAAGTLDRLAPLSIGDRVRDRGRELRSWTVRDADGTVRARVERTADDGPASILARRSRLSAILGAVVPTGSVRSGVVPTRIDQSRAGVEVEFDDGVRERFDVVVGADGVHSTVRRLLGGTDARFCGTTNWVFETDADLVSPHEVLDVWTDGRTALTAFDAGDRTVVSLLTLADEGQHAATPLDDVGSPDAPFDRLPAEPFDRLSPETVFHRDNYCVRTDTRVDRRVALLGDAARATHPLSAAGVTPAVVDSVVLADQLARHADDPSHALATYADRRSNAHDRPRTASSTSPDRYPDSPLTDALGATLHSRETRLETLLSRDRC